MSRTHQPRTVELTGTGKVYYVNDAGEHVAFDRARYRDARPWAKRKLPVDTREMVL